MSDIYAIKEVEPEYPEPLSFLYRDAKGQRLAE